MPVAVQENLCAPDIIEPNHVLTLAGERPHHRAHNPQIARQIDYPELVRVAAAYQHVASADHHNVNAVHLHVPHMQDVARRYVKHVRFRVAFGNHAALVKSNLRTTKRGFDAMSIVTKPHRHMSSARHATNMRHSEAHEQANVNN
jgi:hypothetical protein